MFFLRSFLFLSYLLLVGWPPAFAQVKSDELLNRLQPQGYVNDFAGVFPADQHTALSRLLLELEEKTSA